MFMHRKAQPIRLPRTMVGILAKNYDADLVERAQIESSKNRIRLWIDVLLTIFAVYKCMQLFKIGFADLGLKELLPGMFCGQFHMVNECTKPAR